MLVSIYSCLNKHTTIKIPLFFHLFPKLLQLSQLLLLFRLLRKVLLVEEAQTHVTIFTSGDEATHQRSRSLPPLAIGTELHRVHGTEGALHATNLLLGGKVVEQALQSHSPHSTHLHLLRARRRHIARLHTTDHHQLVQNRRQRRAVQRSVRREAANLLLGQHVEHLRFRVLARRREEGAVVGGHQARDAAVVRPDRVLHLARGGVDDAQHSFGITRHEVQRAQSPCDNLFV